MKSKVELYPAHGWDCDACGAQNFCRGVVFEPSEEERRELEELGMVGGQIDGHWTTIPGEVTCSECGASFETVHFEEEEETPE